MRRTIWLMVFILFINQCLSQKGFPKQFQATSNTTVLYPWQSSMNDFKQILYDYDNLRVRVDIQGWRTKQNEAYMIIYKPEGAEKDSPASQDFTLFNFHPDYPLLTKNDCWYRTGRVPDMGPLPTSWFHYTQVQFDIQSWFPLPSNLIDKGEEWIPEVQLNAIRYDSPEICDLKRSGRGQVPCLSYFETQDRPAKTIKARAAHGDYDNDEYVSTIYLSFTNGIPAEAEHLFDLPDQWPSYCGNANTDFDVDPVHGFVVTPDGQDHFMIKLLTPPVHSLGDQVKLEFEVEPSQYFNGTRCAKFNTIVFDNENWQVPQQVNMSFIDYGCCIYTITAKGGGYEWQYTPSSITVYACDGQAGYGCKGKEPCGG